MCIPPIPSHLVFSATIQGFIQGQIPCLVSPAHRISFKNCLSSLWRVAEFYTGLEQRRGCCLQEGISCSPRTPGQAPTSRASLTKAASPHTHSEGHVASTAPPPPAGTVAGAWEGTYGVKSGETSPFNSLIPNTATHNLLDGAAPYLQPLCGCLLFSPESSIHPPYEAIKMGFPHATEITCHFLPLAQSSCGS